MRATVRDVATLAGVSPKTVSNVVNGGVPVRAETRQRVQSAIEQLDYVPNMSARGLRNGRSGNIALALPDVSTPYSAELARWFVELAHDRGWAVQIEQSGDSPERERELMSRARTHLVDGLVLNPTLLNNSPLAEGPQDGAPLPPTVVIGEVEPAGVDQVHVDSRAAAREVTEHLLATGHRRIAIVGGSGSRFRSATSMLREAGYRDAIDAAGIPFDVELDVVTTSWTAAAAASEVEALLDRQAVPPDAFFCFTDSMAIGTLSVLARRGLRVPEDVSVVGFDDIAEAAFAIPALTTVRFDRRAVADAALSALERRIEDRDAPETVTVIPYEVVHRASVADRREQGREAWPA